MFSSLAPSWSRIRRGEEEEERKRKKKKKKRRIERNSKISGFQTSGVNWIVVPTFDI